MTQPRADLIRAIVDEQREDGSFPSLSTPTDAPDWANAVAYTTTFTTAAVVLAMADLPGDEAARVRERAVDWLLAQAGPRWSFNYWGRQEPMSMTKPYPDDWDDTACALAAIMRVRPAAITGEVLAQAVTLLTQCEAAEGGPYRTWIVGDDVDAVWRDVDLAVNANIGYLLSLQGVTLPKLEALVAERFGAGHLNSPYYPTTLPVVYFLSRWYRGELVVPEAKGALQTAMAVTAAVNLGMTPDRDIAEKLQMMPARAEAFCYDPAIEGKKYVAGSAALTAALMLEALYKYESCQSLTPQVSNFDRADDVHERVLERVLKRYDPLEAEWVQERVLKDDPVRQITMLPYLFAGALGRPVPETRLVQLGAMSLYGWLAYTIFDDFLDNEGEPERLPMAINAARALVLMLANDEAAPEFWGYAKQTLERMDAASSWEVRHCRVGGQDELITVTLPNYGDLSNLADRSFGHALSAVALVMELGYKADSQEVRSVAEFFRHLLIARQLNDEAHDWKADLERGHINAVGAILLERVEREQMTVEKLYPALEKLFWEQVIIYVCDRILAELELARGALVESKIVRYPERLEPLMEPIAAAAGKARIEQRQTLDFLRAYEQDHPA